MISKDSPIANVLRMHWHERQPIFSVDFCPRRAGARFATAGGDGKVRIWRLADGSDFSINQKIDLGESLPKTLEISKNYLNREDNLVSRTKTKDSQGHIIFNEQLDYIDLENNLNPDQLKSTQSYSNFDQMNVSLNLSEQVEDALNITKSLDASHVGMSVVSSIDGESESRKKNSTKCNESLPLYCATLAKHQRPVNCVRFSPSGDFLASAGDGGIVFIWCEVEKKDDDDDDELLSLEKKDIEIDDESEGGSEKWSLRTQFCTSPTSNEDVYDISWSPDESQVILALTDNTAQVWCINSRRCISILRDHVHFVQGVAWDPLNRFLVTCSCDRSSRIYRRSNKTLAIQTINRLCRVGNDANANYLFHDESLVSFFRRPCFSPDGGLLFLPAGLSSAFSKPVELEPSKLMGDNKERKSSSFYVMTRGAIGSYPVAMFTGFSKAVIGIRCNPRLFPLKSTSMFALPYRVVWAAYSVDSVAIFDTSSKCPKLVISDLHYGSLTDVSWSPSGLELIVTATDGFCSLIRLDSAADFCIGSPLNYEDQAYEIEAIKRRLQPPNTSLSSTVVVNETMKDEEKIESLVDIPMSELTMDSVADQQAQSEHYVSKQLIEDETGHRYQTCNENVLNDGIPMSCITLGEVNVESKTVAQPHQNYHVLVNSEGETRSSLMEIDHSIVINSGYNNNDSVQNKSIINNSCQETLPVTTKRRIPLTFVGTS